MIMQKEKLKGYESPTTELIVLQIENGILVVSGSDSIILDATIDDWGTL